MGMLGILVSVDLQLEPAVKLKESLTFQPFAEVLERWEKETAHTGTSALFEDRCMTCQQSCRQCQTASMTLHWFASTILSPRESTSSPRSWQEKQ
jgi:hypothetical protein